jgi:hypothetical protein
MPRPNALVIDSDTYSHDTSRYRRQFLRAVHKTTPEVMEALRDELLPLFKTSALFRAVSAMFAWVEGEPKDQPATPAQIEAFKRVLNQWAEKFGLRDQWLLEVAVRTLNHWRKKSDALGALYWAELPFTHPPLPPEDREIEFRHAGWRVETEYWSEFASRTNAAFKQHLRSYRETIRRNMSDLGLSLPPEIRNPEHYTWLALYQIRRYSPASIAELLNSDQKTLLENTVLKAVKSTADLVGLTLRQPRKGKGPKRPRVTTKHPRRRKKI